MKKIVISLIAVVLILFCVVLARTASFTSKQEKAEPAQVIDLDSKKLLKNLSDAVKIKTVSHLDESKFDGGEFVSFQRLLENAFPEIHRSLKKETVNRHGILYTWNGSDAQKKPIIIMAHYDVVPVEQGTEQLWTQPPFGGIVKDGYLWGRGTLDDKGSLMSSLEAVEWLLSKGFKPARTVHLAFGFDEELGGLRGAKKIVEVLNSRNVKAEYVIDEGAIIEGAMKGISAPIALISVAEKGYASLEFSVSGEGGHSSMPPAETPVGILCAAIGKLEKNPFPLKIEGVTKKFLEYLGPEMPLGNRLALANLWLLDRVVKSQLAKSPASAALLHTTIAPTMLQGSIKDNVLPMKAVAVVNFRIIPGETSAGVLEYCKKAIGDPRVEIKPLGPIDEPSLVSDPDVPSFGVLKKTVRQIFPDAVVAPFLAVGRSDAKHYSAISKNVYRFAPYHLKADDLKRLHGVDERISVSNYEKMVRFYVQLIKNSVQ